MIKVRCFLSVVYHPENRLSPASSVVYAATAADVDWFGAVSGFEVTTRESGPSGISKMMKVDCDESSPALAALLAAIKDKYGFDLYPTPFIPIELRDTHFCMRRFRTFSRDEVEKSELLRLGSDRAIANYKQPTFEQIKSDTYVAEKSSRRSRTSLGYLSPFDALAVDGDLKGRMEALNLRALDLSKEVINGGGLWRLFSTVMLPRCHLRLVTAYGETIKDLDVWEQHESRVYDDGCQPPILIYRRAEIDQLPPFDIAITAERVHGHNHSAYRQCIVTQRFKARLRELNVSGINYTPVRLT